MKKTIFIYLLFLSTATIAQQTILKGDLFDEDGNPLVYATAVLLNPSDSTMAFYGITNAEGHFEIKSIKSGNYVLQTAYMGYQSYYKNLKLPLSEGNNLGAIIMKPILMNLSEVQVSAERIPILIKKDTVEYNAGAFKVKPDAVAEELLKKLPGVQVDRAGNIKAQGENVQKVLVDGKEFFGSDPQVATKNLPADAIEKVQVYNKKSEETELTGIDDGTYSKTINMVLKDGMKSAIFGDITAGIGTDEKYQAGAKVYRFTRKHQFAALAMLNNVNKYGFSFRDYLDFNGGLQSLLYGGGGQISFGMDSDLPINFGQNINGLVTSGAVGGNFTYEARKNNRFNISYLGNGADKKLKENTFINNFFETGSFIQKEELEQNTSNRAHRVNFGWRNRLDSSQNLIINGGVNFTNGTAKGILFSESFENDLLMNKLNSLTNDDANSSTANVSASYLKKWKSNWKLLKIKGNFSINHNNSNKHWDNLTRFFDTTDSLRDLGFQKDKNNLLRYSASTSVTRKIGRLWYFVPAISAGIVDESLDRKHGIPPGDEHLTDSLSPDFSREYFWMRGGFSIKRNTKKSQISFTARIENARLSNSLKNENEIINNRLYFTPLFSWHYEYSTGRQLGVSFGSSVNSPNANQLLPVVNNINPLQLYKGNSYLKPEYSHDLRFNWIFFDQFSFTSIFASLNANYTADKINWSRTIMPNLTQMLSLINVADDYRISGSFDFSTPIRKAGMNFSAKLHENWNQGINLVNGEQNINTNFSHSLTLSFDNRKKEKWDVSVGGTFQISDAKYSIQNSLNKTYYNLLGFSDIIFTPNDNWYFSLTADINRYEASSFNNSISIPLLKAEITRYFLKNKRGVITLEVFDFLDKNTGVERISEMNYLLERQSNTIGRYFMISFKYRLNKFDNKSGIDIKMSKR